MDDKTGERPHAGVAHVVRRTQRGTFEWVASSSRLEQSLHDLDELPGATDTNLQHVWDRWNSVIKTRNVHTRAKVSRKELVRRVYFLQGLLEFTDGLDIKEETPLSIEDTKDEGDPDDGAVAQDAVLALEDAVTEEEGEEVARGSNEGRRVRRRTEAAPPPAVVGEVEQDEGAVVEALHYGPPAAHAGLMRQWLEKSLSVGDYFTVFSSDHAPGPARVFQYLSGTRRNVKVSTFLDSEKASFLFDAVVQPLERWGGSAESAHTVPSSLETYVVEEPHHVDILAMTGSKPDKRCEILRWSPVLSDVVGCVSLADPRPLEPVYRADLADAPALVLLDKLEEAGFSKVARKTVHASDAELVVDVRNPLGHQDYFRALLQRQKLFSGGIHTFHSGKPASWFRLALLRPSPALLALTGKQCLLALKDCPVAPALPALEAPTEPGPSAGGATPRLVIDYDVSSVDSANDSDATPPASTPALENPLPLPLPAPEPEIDEPSSSESSSSSSSSCSESASEAGEGSVPRSDLPVIDGMPVVADIQQGVRGPIEGWKVRCANPAHRDANGCHKYRSRTMDVPRFGEDGTLRYLQCWQSRCRDMSPSSHKKWRPKVAEIQEWLANQ